MDLLQRLDEILFVIAVTVFNVVHDVKHLVDIQVVCNHQLEEFSDSVVHGFIDLFELVSSFNKLLRVVVCGSRHWFLLRNR